MTFAHSLPVQEEERLKARIDGKFAFRAGKMDAFIIQYFPTDAGTVLACGHEGGLKCIISHS